jgi:hypothetical protein
MLPLVEAGDHEERYARAREPRTIRARFKRNALAVALLALAFVAWTTRPSRVDPPATVADPVTVRLLATGLHSGLLLPCGDGRTVEYGFGEWGWYAHDEDAWWRAPWIALVPSQGALGRRYVRDEDLAAMGERYGSGKLASIQVSRETANGLLANLDAQFAAGGEPYHNEKYDMWFVKVPARFHLFHDCHDEAANWLRELGCSVAPRPIRARLSVRTAR